MIEFLRGLALLALMLPALLLPRGVTFTACLCGEGLDAEVCMVTCVEDARPECCRGELDCAEEPALDDAARGSQSDLPSVDTDHHCPDCHLLQVEHAGTDFVDEAAPVAVDSDPCLALLAPVVPCWNSAALRRVSVGRAPPWVVPCPGARPGVLPLRI